MRLSKYEKETIILFNEEETTASICTYNRKMQNQLMKFAEKSADCIFEKRENESVTYKIPKSWIKINMPRKTKRITLDKTGNN